jgi:hypothetical protein
MQILRCAQDDRDEDSLDFVDDCHATLSSSSGKSISAPIRSRFSSIVFPILAIGS